MADIARKVGVRYQHAYNVLKAAGLLRVGPSNVMPLVGSDALAESHRPQTAKPTSAVKPALTVDRLVSGGFRHSARWLLADELLLLDQPLPTGRGVYAFVRDGAALYVGLATMGLAKRLYFYGKPGATQRTSQRINGLLKAELTTRPFIDIYTAVPPNLTWNGLPISGDAGLELGLIESFALPWNIRGVRAG